VSAGDDGFGGVRAWIIDHLAEPTRPCSMASGAFDPKSTREALAVCGAGPRVGWRGVDLNSPPRAMAEYAELFAHARLVIPPGAGHFPWLDDPDQFVATTAAFLG
jgi:proline iminopeptidase